MKVSKKLLMGASLAGVSLLGVACGGDNNPPVGEDSSVGDTGVVQDSGVRDGNVEAGVVTRPMGTLTCTDIGMMVGASVQTGTTLAADTNNANPPEGCSDSTSPDRGFTWTAPSAGAYVFSTVGSSFDTVIYLRQSCTGEVLSASSCNDDVNYGEEEDPTTVLQSHVVANVTQGQSLAIVIDGYGNDSFGNYTLSIRKLAEPVGTETLTPEQLNVETNETAAASCACGFASADPPFADAAACTAARQSSTATQSCRATAYNSVGAAALAYANCQTHAQIRYQACSASVQTCNAQATSECDALLKSDGDACELSNELGTQLNAAFDVCINGPRVSACPDETSSNAVGDAVITGTTVQSGNDFTPNCASGTASDKIYAWTAPSSGTVTVTSAGSAIIPTLFVRDTCTSQTVENAAPDLACAVAPATGSTSLNFLATQGTTYFIGVDSPAAASAGTFQLNITIAAPEACPNGTASSAVGASVFSGTTATASNDFERTTCDGAAISWGRRAKDVVLQWTAPSTGSFVIDTVGSTFDTILELRASCSAATATQCNDDIEAPSEESDGNLQSRLTLSATAGTSYFIVVDGVVTTGSMLTEGNYVVNINPAN